MNAPSPEIPGVRVTTCGFTLAGAGPAMLALARVTMESAQHAAIGAAWLNGAEHTRSARFAVAHARADFLAGRVAAKTAARVLRPKLSAPSTWAIVPGEHQRPRLDHVAPGVAVSIAHAGGVGLALVYSAQARCGIDLEPLDRDADEVIATQVAPAEATWARAGGTEERLRWLLLWTAREAQGKSWGTGLLEPDRLVPTAGWTPVSPGWRAGLAGATSLEVRSIQAGGQVISLVVPAGTEVDSLAQWLVEALTTPVGGE